MKKMRGGANVRASMGGGAHLVDEENKETAKYRHSINSGRDEEAPLI